jgi:HlyD family secretion protein
MGKKLKILGIVVALLVAVGIGAVLMTRRSTAPTTTTVANRTVVESAVMSGRVSAAARLELGVSAPGIVAKVAVTEGQVVAAGDLLVQLDDALERAALAQARAQVLQAKAQLQEAQGSGRARAAAALAVAEAERAKAELQATRIKRLAEQGAAPALDRDNAETAVLVARAQQDRASADVAAFSDGGSQVAVARAAVAMAEAQVQQAEARLSVTRMVARSAATVLVRRVEPGEAVAPGRALLSLAPTGTSGEGVEIVVEPDERVLAVLAVGQLADVSADAFPDRIFAARVLEIAPVVDAGRGTVSVRLLVPEPPAFLRTDMTVSVEVKTGEKQGLTVPASAVRGLATPTPSLLVVTAGVATEVRVTVVARGSAAKDPAVLDKAVGTAVGAGGAEVAVVAATAGGHLIAGDIVVLDPAVKAGAKVKAVAEPAS